MSGISYPHFDIPACKGDRLRDQAGALQGDITLVRIEECLQGSALRCHILSRCLSNLPTNGSGPLGRIVCAVRLPVLCPCIHEPLDSSPTGLALRIVPHFDRRDVDEEVEGIGMDVRFEPERREPREAS